MLDDLGGDHPIKALARQFHRQLTRRDVEHKEPARRRNIGDGDA